jgi:hypothetical protein
MAIVRAVLVVALLVVGAAGLSSLEDDDFCTMSLLEVGDETSSERSEAVLWPPGTRCVVTRPDGGEVAVESGSAGWFLVALAALLGVAAWHGLRPERARLAFAAALALGAVGVCGLAGAAALLALVGGAIVGTPLAWSAGRWPGAAAAVVCVAATGVLWLAGLEEGSFLFPLFLVALMPPPRDAG